VLSSHYKQKIMNNLWSLFFSSNALGNVNMLAYDIGTGVKDFFYKPIDGFIIGPLEGGKGLYRGTSSLIFNTSKGTFGSVSKIMNSISKGLLIFTDD
jgi:vacuolar protein sorting-associated protein 13A/C